MARRPARPRPAPEAPPRGAPGGRRLLHVACAIVLATGLVRLLFAAVAPLVPDEAYYWDWSRQLSPGYFDHPPAIALLIAAGTALFGATPLGVRLWPVIAGVLTVLLLVDIARRHGGPMAALWTAAAAACVPLAAAGLVLATPDAPLLLAYALGLNAIDRAIAAGPGSRASLQWWAVAGLAAGMGLTSKYTAVLLPLGVTIAFALRPSLRPWFRTREPYLAAAISLLLFTPVIAWNARHDWASFAFQLNHGFGAGGGRPVGQLLEMFAGQAVLVSPILFVLLGAAVVRTAVRGSDDRLFVLATVALTTFGFFTYSALHDRIEPNWPAAAYLPGFVLLGLAAAAAPRPRWYRAGLGLGAAMVVLVYVQTMVPLLPVEPRKDPMARGHGWDALAATVARAAPPTEGEVWFAANRYQDAAQLAFHLPGTPEVFSLNLRVRPNHYDFRPGFADRARPGDDLVFVVDANDGGDAIVRDLLPHFAGARRATDVELRRGGGVITTRRVWVLREWQGSWPQRRTPG